jgi:hypothetical protein
MANDLTGRVFGRLTVLEKSDFVTGDGRTTWRCRCNNDGNLINVVGKDLTSGKKQSCGCLKKEIAGNMARTHGMSTSPEYATWCSMKSRCYNPNFIEYQRYGSANVEMCEEWKNSFEAFYADMGPKPSPEHTIDRIDNDKGYSKANCRWATKKEQSTNRRNVVLYEFNGESLCLAEIARRCNIHDQTLRDRIKKGMSVYEATTG